jgi:DNA-directed RNA polymerase subunit RPC12/RpoP
MDSQLHFQCIRCRHNIDESAVGTKHRNHCPACLWSIHLDDRPGDRGAPCGGQMEPIAVWVRRDGEWALIHRCQRCGTLRSNRVAGDDSVLGLMSLAVRAIASPPFPLEYLERMLGR